jgi:hypothetical protein
MNRKLNFSFLPMHLSKVIYESGKVQLRDILKLPSLAGDMDTVQEALESALVTYNFITNFDGVVEPTLNLSDYEMLVTLLKYTMSNLKIERKTEKENKAVKRKFVFSPMNYKFNPGFKVGIGASISPDVAWLLARFGISDEHIIPASLFEYVCLGLESFLLALARLVKTDE